MSMSSQKQNMSRQMDNYKKLVIVLYGNVYCCLMLSGQLL